MTLKKLYNSVAGPIKIFALFPYYDCKTFFSLLPLQGVYKCNNDVSHLLVEILVFHVPCSN